MTDKKPAVIPEHFPEAAAVVNIDYKRTDGFVVKLTLRDATGEHLLTRLEGAIAKIKEEGGTPYEKSFGTKFPPKPIEYVEGQRCPLDGGRLVKSTTKAGKKFVKCENNKWNATLRKPEGCSYTQWEQEPPVRDVREDY